jgi:acyl-CoA thioesterase-1
MTQSETMDWFIFLCASGLAYFLGIGAVLLSVALFSFFGRAWAAVISTLIALAGVIFIAISATPAPYWLYTIAGIVTILWLISERSRRTWMQSQRKLLRWSVIAVRTFAAALELPFHFTPALPAIGRQKLYVLGDSITAGISSRDETWPRVLAREHSIEVADLSHVGAFVEPGLKMANHLPSEGGLVLLELGGNDLLGRSSSVADFERFLDQLLARVCVSGRTVVMFELPLPPFYNDFGVIQRRLARQYGVHLIPKRILIGILTTNGTTVDGLHLTQAGHERMATVVWDVIRGAYGECRHPSKIVIT